MRGVDIDHGTDINISVDGMPVNMVSHAHGQGYADLFLNYTTRKFEAGVAVQNLFDTRWKETHFDTESRLKDETAPVSEIHSTPGTPFFLKTTLTYLFKLMQLLKYMVTKKVLTLLSACIFFGVAANAHEVNYALENAPTGNVAWFYTKLGFEHIVPLGLDHILFVVCLCLLNNKVKTVLWQATAFTIAHSITLALSIQNVFTLPGAIVEPIIALSILFVAVENLIIRELKPWRVAIVFFFGLIHGLGFASVLKDIGLPRDQFALSLISFNVGVELGQLSIIAIVFTFLYFFERKTWYKQRIVYPVSFLIIFIAAYWTIQRISEV